MRPASLASLVVLAACGPGGVVAPTENEPAPPPLRTDEASAYVRDAARLAYRRQEGTPLGERTVELPLDLVDDLFNALLRVRSSEWGHKVTGIHTTDRAVLLNEVVLVVDTSASWLVPWRRGARTTGNEEVDQLLVEYGLHVKEYEPTGFFEREYITLRSPTF